MKNTVPFSLGLMFFFSLAQSTPWRLPGNAVIASEYGRLLICMPQKISENMEINSISVSESQPLNGQHLTMWQLELKKNWEGLDTRIRWLHFLWCQPFWVPICGSCKTLDCRECLLHKNRY